MPRERTDPLETLDFLGAPTQIKADATSTGGRVAVLEVLEPPGGGSPLHRHTREDEWFYVLDGEVTFWLDGETVLAGPGDVVFAPNEAPHTYLVTSPEPARLLMVVQPAGFEDLVRTVSEPGFDPERLEQVAADHGIEVLGPPGLPGPG